MKYFFITNDKLNIRPVVRKMIFNSFSQIASTFFSVYGENAKSDSLHSRIKHDTSFKEINMNNTF